MGGAFLYCSGMEGTAQTGHGRARLNFDLPGEGERTGFLLKRHAVSLAFGMSAVYTFDLSGRLYGAFVAGRNYRRGLDDRVIEKWRYERDGQEVKVCREMTPEARQRFYTAVHERVASAALALRKGACQVRQAEPADALETAVGWLDRIGTWDGDALAKDGARFLEIYRPVSILPPDQYMALVAQATEGCPWNRCTFCNFYRDRPFKIKSSDELRAHLASVKAFLGEGIRLRRSIFLGDANALTIPWRRLQQTFAVIQASFPSGNPEGPSGNQIYAFTDALGANLRTRQEVETLAEMGLRRVYIGLETGHTPLLELVDKQGSAEEMVAAVRGMKAGGVAVGVIVMLGLGGARFAEAHIRDTVLALNAMELGRRDMVYFSEMVASPDLDYARQVRQLGIRPLDGQEMRAQMADIRSGLRFAPGAGRPMVSIYDIRRFIY